MINNLKVRAWDKGNRIWQYFTIEDMFKTDKGFYQFLENFCLFTGLQDKNGKEIYERDICKAFFNIDEIDDGYCKLDDGLWLPISDVEKNRGYIIFSVDSPFFNNQPELNAGSNRLEVIGNKHENPELLEVKNGS